MRAIDEPESLALLVGTLNAIDEPGARSHLMCGMLRGLEGRRRVAAPKGWSMLNEEVSSLVESLLDEDGLCLNAIRGYAIVENESAPAVLLARYKQMSPELRRAVIETLATRRRYVEELLTAIKQQSISHEEIPAHVARSLREILRDRFVKVFGTVRRFPKIVKS